MLNAANERSLAEIGKDLTHDLTRLMKSELELMKAELQENISRLGTGAGLFGGAGFIGIFALEFLLLALMFGIAALGLKMWLAALIVGVLLAIVAGVLAMSGKKKVAGASIAPQRAIQHMKSDADMIKADVERLRSR